MFGFNKQYFCTNSESISVTDLTIITQKMMRMAKAVVYTAPKCPHSLKLKDFLKEINIDFEEKGVFDNPETFKEIFEATEQRGIPVVIIDGEAFIGFEKRTQRKIKRKVGA